MAEHEEDWPILRPQRAHSSGTLQEMMRETGSELIRQASTADGERYPVLGDTTSTAISEQLLPISIFSSTHKILRKEASTTSLRKSSEPAERDITDPFQDGNTITDNAHAHHTTSHPSALSAGAAALEKSTSQDFTEVRQTRTSSLRARLSAGDVVSDRNSKVMGFTDFTAEPAKANTRHGSLRMRKEVNARPSVTYPAPTHSLSTATLTLNTKVSKESLSSHPPANFIAGSRRPLPSRRPGSRGSLHDDTHPPATKAPTRPPSRCALEPTNNHDHPTGKRSTESERRRSSLPVPVSACLDAYGQVSLLIVAKKVKNDDQPTKKSTKPEIIIFDDEAASVAAEVPGKTSVNTTNQCEDSFTTKETIKEAHGLESIDESPRHTYRIRSLSTKSPNFGPTLSISPSADKYIMGIDDDKENQPPKRKNSNEFKGKQSSTQTTKIVREFSDKKKRPQRPLSSYGQPSPRVSIINSDVREKKARSADLMLVNRLATVEQVDAKPLSKNSSVATTASSNADPFYDASEEPQVDLNITSKAEDGVSTVQDEDSIVPMSNVSNTVSSGDGEASVPVASPDATPHASEKVRTSPRTDEYDPFKYDTVPREDSPAVKIGQPTTSTRGPITPPQPKTISSSTYPERSSSHMPKSGVNIKTSKTLYTHAVTKETSPPTPPKEFVDRQNNLGSSRGHASSQMDLLKSSTKRDSAARDSFKSQTSMPTSVSKSRFNLKGLFHKRPTENVDNATKSKRKTKGKVAINANGSPFPPINEIHPIHRPTLASSARSQATTPRSSTHVTSSQSTRHRPQTPLTPNLTSPEPISMSRTTSLAISLLESARREQSSPKKEKLLALGKVVVDVITQARDAEKAVEECKLALGRAEKAREACTKAVIEVGGMVEGVRGVGAMI